MLTENVKVPHIVLAEDNPSDVMLVRMALEAAALDCGLSVIGDGGEVLAFIDSLDEQPKAGIDLLLLDLHLPRRNGEEILKGLRSAECCAQTPVVVMSGSDLPQDQILADKYAAIHYFRKPISLDQFMQLGLIVRGILSGNKRAETEPASQAESSPGWNRRSSPTGKDL